MSCCPLHNHSEYSAIDGVSRISEIADRMEDIGATACGLTDHGVVAGHLEFDKEFRKRDLKPIFGCELYHGVRIGEKLGRARDQAHLIALATTDEGLKNLWRLNDAAAQEPKYHHVGRNSWEDLERYKDGLVVTSACALSLVSQGALRGDYSDLNRYLEIFGDNFYIELATYPGDAVFNDRDSDEGTSPRELNEALVGIARERGIPLVYGDDGHYAFPHQYEAHDLYVARATGDSLYTPIEDRKMWHPEGALCIKSEDDVREALSYLPDDVVDEAVANSVEIAERANARLPGVERHLPVFVPSDSPWVDEDQYSDDDADLLFLDLVEKGMRERYGEDPPENVVKQTQYESEVFLDSGLHHYFLLAWDVMQFCDNAPERPIERGPGRGSSAGCIVAYELGITDIDPLPYDLYFERFWNPGRAKGFPDIDSDFEKGRLKEVSQYLSRRWGHDRVRTIGTVMRMKPLAVVENLGSTCGLTDEDQKTLKDMIRDVPDIDILGVDQIGWDEDNDPGKVVYVMHSTPQTEHDVGERILDWVESLPDKRQYVVTRFLDLAASLCNRAASYGVHPSGVVVSDVDLPDLLPCRFAGSPDQRIPVTQFAMDDVDALQFVKFDRLGLRTLDVLAGWKQRMKDRHDIDIDWSGLEWTDYDPDLWNDYGRGRVAGFFQIERGFPRELCQRTEPRSIDDLSLILAGNRPGPIRSGAVESMVTRLQGGEDDKFDGRLIPILKDILEPTVGWFLYQEQVIAYFNTLGYEPSDADAVRKILGKKQPEKWDALYHGKEEWEGKSYVQMTEGAGLDRETADEIWDVLVDFAKYSFNKAHTVAYGTITFRCGFAKFYGAEEFYESGIENVDKNKKTERIPEFVNEARAKGITVHGVDIERSGITVGLHGTEIYFGFSDVKHISAEAARMLIELRAACDVDLSTPEKLNEYLEGASKLWSKENARRKKAGEPPQEGKSPKQRLNARHIENLYTAGAWERLEGYPTPLREMQEREREMLNVIVTDNSAEVLAEHAEEIEALEDTYEDAKQPYDGEELQFRLPGIVTTVRETKTRKDKKKMAIVTIEYNGDEIDFAVFPKEWRSHRFLWHERTPGIFTLRLSEYNGKTGYNFKSGVKLD